MGIEIKLSKSHPKYDICDPLATLYLRGLSIGLVGIGNVYAVPNLAEGADVIKIEDEILGIGPGPDLMKNIKEMPSAFNDYLEESVTESKDEKIIRIG